jgi:hypothetical protein
MGAENSGQKGGTNLPQAVWSRGHRRLRAARRRCAAKCGIRLARLRSVGPVSGASEATRTRRARRAPWRRSWPASPVCGSRRRRAAPSRTQLAHGGGIRRATPRRGIQGTTEVERGQNGRKALGGRELGRHRPHLMSHPLTIEPPPCAAGPDDRTPELSGASSRANIGDAGRHLGAIRPITRNRARGDSPIP